MKRYTIVAVLVLACAAVFAETSSAPSSAPASKPSPQKMLEVAKAVAPSLVRVEYVLQYDKGEAPELFGSTERSGAMFISQERPLELAGFLVNPTTVVTADPVIHPRFVKEIAVVFGRQRVNARISGYAMEQNGLILELAEPLKDAKPLQFDPNLTDDFFYVSYTRVASAWTVSVFPFSNTVQVSEDGRAFIKSSPNCAVVNDKAVAVGLAMGGELPADGKWKGSPLGWQVMTDKAFAEQLARVQKAADGGLLRVSLSFRSPTKQPGQRYFGRGDDEESSTEQNVTGVLMAPQKVLVLANLAPKVTARLDRITVYSPDGTSTAGKFGSSLSDYGCFIVDLEKPLAGALDLPAGDLLDYRDKLSLAAEVRQQGEKRVAYFNYLRLTDFRVGWKRNVYVNLSDNDLFLFDQDQRLLAIPVMKRAKSADENALNRTAPQLTWVRQIKAAMDDLANNTDPSNVPLSEAKEHRLAWLGVVLQPLDRELARVNNVSDLTRDGQTGALVSFVYPDSPAAKAQIMQGDVLLRLYVEGESKPRDVRQDTYLFSSRPFPWDAYDRLPEQMYDEIPTPWPPTEDNFSRMLTDIGFGKKYQVELFRDGKVMKKDFEVAQSPAHYESAQRFKSDDLGLTVRELTYEVRQYFQKRNDDPGVIVSKIEQGGKASVAGIKPYEIITHVNDVPVNNVKDFQKLVQGGGEMRLAVKRMTLGRMVKLQSKSATSVPASGPTTGPASAPSEGSPDEVTPAPEPKMQE